MTKEIPLTKGKVAIVDDSDFEYLSKLKWCLQGCGNKRYAQHNFYQSTKRNNVMSMHRFIMNPPKGMTVDHIDGDGLNNQRKNLRICSIAENLRNRKKPNRNSEKYTGIKTYHNKSRTKWRALIGHKGKTIHLGMFDTPEEAARAYDAAAKRLFGEFANLNFKEELEAELQEQEQK